MIITAGQERYTHPPMKLFHIQLLVTSIRLSFPLRIFRQHYFPLGGTGGGYPLSGKNQPSNPEKSAPSPPPPYLCRRPAPAPGWSKTLAANPQVAPPHSGAGGRRQRRRQKEWVVGGEIPLLVGGGWWEPPTSKMSLSSGGGAAHYGFHRPGWIL